MFLFVSFHTILKIFFCWNNLSKIIDTILCQHIYLESNSFRGFSIVKDTNMPFTGEPSTSYLSPLWKVCDQSNLGDGTYTLISALSGSLDLSIIRTTFTVLPKISRWQEKVSHFPDTVHWKGNLLDVIGSGHLGCSSPFPFL